MIVDDDPTYTTFISQVFKNINFETIECYNGLDALSYLNQEKIDLMVVDIMMPDLDGYGLIRALRNHESYSEYREIPLLALTSLSSPVVKARLKEIEADAWIQKPITPQRLLSIVQEFIPLEIC